MSPSTLLDLEEVPFAILEAVKARILASRGNIGKPPPSTRPRPQFRKFGASTKGWRKPQYAAGLTGGDAVLLLHMDGTDGSQLFKDDSASSSAITVAGNAQISTAESKFGGASGLFGDSGSGDYLIAANPALALGTRDFTIESWVKPTGGITSYQAICTFPGLNDTGLFLFQSGGLNATMSLVWYDGSNFIESDDVIQLTGTELLEQTAEWTHVAAVRQSGVIRLFVNGSKQLSIYSNQRPLTNSSVQIGASSSGVGGNGEWYFGYLDELMISPLAAYGDSFTPPTAPFD
jgi:hypothetical protein